MTETSNLWDSWQIPQEIKNAFNKSKEIIIPQTREELVELSMGGQNNQTFNIAYNVEGKGQIIEANVVRCKNGIAVNYTDTYMRRRDPDCLLVSNIDKTDKLSFNDKYGKSFDGLRQETLDWLSGNELIILPFKSGGPEYGYDSLCVVPKNSAFFATALADMQGMLTIDDIETDFEPKAILYVAPPFRHTHFEGKQVVVHNNHDGIHEIYAYNLYPGPSAKKGVYGILLSIGVEEGWTTVHASTVKVTTPYDNEVVFLHEGASGSGKSEMLEYAHREEDGRLLLGRNVITGDGKFISLSQGCKLEPLTDDMALCHPEIQTDSGKLAVVDAEQAWFVRVNHIESYGTEPNLEQATIHAKEPLVFFNIQGHPDATCLIWEHTEDSPGKPCPNPRIVIPRKCIKGIQNGSAEVDYRSFGIRTPICTKEVPSYGILGMLHLLPPALAWLWRLVAPRGFANPSIISSDGLISEGVGSYWPFATGRQVDHANLLLDQILKTPKTRYILIPNQNIGAWSVGFMPQWVVREYLARRGHASFKREKLKESRCALAGFTLDTMQVEGTTIPEKFIRVNTQQEVGNEGYDAGAEMLYEFFFEELKPFLTPDLNPIGRDIINCCLKRGTISDYEKIIPTNY